MFHLEWMITKSTHGGWKTSPIYLDFMAFRKTTWLQDAICTFVALSSALVITTVATRCNSLYDSHGAAERCPGWISICPTGSSLSRFPDVFESLGPRGQHLILYCKNLLQNPSLSSGIEPAGERKLFINCFFFPWAAKMAWWVSLVHITALTAEKNIQTHPSHRSTVASNNHVYFFFLKVLILKIKKYSK